MEKNLDRKAELNEIFDFLNLEGQDILLKYAYLLRDSGQYKKLDSS